MKKSAKRTDVSRIFRTFAREKRASLLTLGHSSKLDGSRLIAALQPKSENIKNIEVYETTSNKHIHFTGGHLTSAMRRISHTLPKV